MTHVAFDADDTLWGHEDVFVNAKSECLDILRPYVGDVDALETRLYAFEKRNLELFGYGVKGFMLSMMETAIELSDGMIPGRDIQRIIDIGKEMIAHPIELLPEVESTIRAVRRAGYVPLVITKGDLFDQENKLARSGLAELFEHVEIVSEKSSATYRTILERYAIDPDRFVMIGNSIRSDIQPVLEIGGYAIHNPYHLTWMHERAGEVKHPRYHRVGSLGEVPDLLKALLHA